jgi:hypothetical protein
MWDFIWHLRGSAPVHRSVSDEEVLDRVERLLERQRKPASWRGPSDLTFYVPLWEDLIGPNWLAMVIYERGSFWIEQSSRGRLLKYDLRSLHGLVFCLLVAITFFVFGITGNGLSEALSYAALGFGWIYGMNMVLARYRVPRAIRAAVADR